MKEYMRLKLKIIILYDVSNGFYVKYGLMYDNLIFGFWEDKGILYCIYYLSCMLLQCWYRPNNCVSNSYKNTNWSEEFTLG